jgi:NADH-quinone oxidoreductase subunit H
MELVALLTVLVKILVVLLLIPVIVGFCTLAERKILGRIQVRYGPNRAGPFGLLQWMADAVKLISKEYLIPEQADKAVFVIAPVLTLVPAVTVFALIPFGKGIGITDVNVGLLMLVAISSLGIFGVIFGGWASNSKYSLLGAMRSAAQMISYELAMGLSLVAVVMMAGTMRMTGIVEAQQGLWFIVAQPLGFIVFFIAGIAETNRLPFDMPEAEGDLGAGYHTEYSAMGFGLFQLGEYASIITICALITTFFLGGWGGPWAGALMGLPSLVYFVLKTAFFVFVFIWIRGTLPRVRPDQLMAFGWKILLPAALLNILFVAVIVSLGIVK